MSIEITSQMLEKLNHDLLEIRIRTLKDIDGKINRGILQDKTIIFNPVALVRSLIRWFGQKPIFEEGTILNLITFIFKSKYGKEVFTTFGRERIEKEINKIKLLIPSNYTIDINNIYVALDELQFQINQDEILTSARRSERSNPVPVIDLTSLEEALDQSIHTDYVKCWSLPVPLELNNLKTINESLKQDDKNEVCHALKYMNKTIRDYPAEYFLQPPFLYKTIVGLLKIYDTPNGNILEILTALTKSLQKRINIRQLADVYCWIDETNLHASQNMYNQISTQVFCHYLIKEILKYLREILDKYENFVDVTKSFKLIMELIALLERDETQKYDTFNDLLKEFGIFAKYLRTNDEKISDHGMRVNYLITIQIIAKLSQIIYRKDNTIVSAKNYNLNDFQSDKPTKNLTKKNWYQELEIALLDFTLKEVYPEIYKLISNVIGVETLPSNSRIKILLDSYKQLIPAVEILRNPKNFTDEELISKGLKSIETLNLHKSIELVQLLFKIICRSIIHFDVNSELKENCEKLFLQLLSHEMIEVKLCMYNMCAEKVKMFFSSLMDGETMMSKYWGSKQSGQSYSIGIPITIEILTEIICFGCESSETVIRCNSETILIFIVRGKTVLGSYWNKMMETVYPVLPLLQCITEPQSGLGKAILELFDPDNDIDLTEIIKGNMRFLFNKNPLIRDEAVSRLIYIISSHPQTKTNAYQPNLLNISDTLTNTICFVEQPINPINLDVPNNNDDNDKINILPLLELIKGDNIEPSIRKTALMQLNLLATNKNFAEIIHNENGWYYILTALDNSLKDEHTNDYPDSAIPAVGIFTKLCLHLPHYRRGMTFEPNILFLLLRSLIIYQNSIVHKSNCTISMFLLLYSDYILGDYNKLSIPHIFSKLQIPIKCDYHWRTSTNIKKSQLEELINTITKNNNNISTTPKISATTIMNSPKNELIINEEMLLRFLRFNFTTIWFSNFNNILYNAKMLSREKNADTQQTPRIDYTQITTNNSNETVKTLSFNSNLKLTKKDLLLIKTTEINEIFNYYLRKIQNATNYTDINRTLSRIQSNLLLPIHNNNNNYQLKMIELLKKYYTSPPKDTNDGNLFISVIDLLGIHIELDFNDVLIQILKQLNEKNSVFMIILKTNEFSTEIFNKNNIFLTQLIRNCRRNFSNSDIRRLINGKRQNNEISKSLCYKLFEIIVENLLDINIVTKEIDNIRSLIVLLRIITYGDKFEFDDDYLNRIVNRLFSLITLSKSFNQSGSDFIKNCLLTICNLLNNIILTNIKEEYIRLLSGMCGHSDFIIKSTSWNILSKIAINIKEAERMIKILAYLPGGIHACCLCTVLDQTEVGLVKEAAAGLFGSLLKHGTNKNLPINIAPNCMERKIQSDDTGYKLLMLTVKQQNIYDQINKSLEYFQTPDIIDNNFTDRLITCNVIRGYCVILISLIDLDTNLLNDYDVFYCIYHIISVLVKVPLVVSASSIKMVIEISKLLVRSCKFSTEFLNRIVMYEHGIMASFGYLLNLKHFENCSREVRNDCIINIMQVIRILIETENGYKFYSTLWSDDNCKSLIILLNKCLKLKQTEELRISSMILLSTMFDNEITDNIDENSNFITFYDSFNKIKMNDSNDDQKTIDNDCNMNENTMAMKQYRINKLKQQTQQYVNGGTEILMIRLIELFNYQCTKDKPQNGLILSSYEKLLNFRTIAILLKTSSNAREIANNMKFLDKLIERLENIFIGFGMSCTDFIRKNGDHKKEVIIEDLSLITFIILCWFQNDSLNEENIIKTLLQIFLKLWPWTNTNTELQLKFMNCLVVLSEDSIGICKGITTIHVASSQTLIQLIGCCVKNETNKVKCPQVNLDLLKSGLRVLGNTCSCIEGRLQINKMNLIDIISKLHPSITKQQKPWNQITIYWLKFWSVFTRYPEVNSVRHLSVLCALLQRTNKLITIRTESLNILKNMAFSNDNRAALLASDEFLYNLKQILDDNKQDEQFLVVLIIWKLITNNYKGKHVIKNSSIPSKIENLLKFLSIDKNCFNPDLKNVVIILNNLLKE